MNAHDEGSDASHGRGAPRGPDASHGPDAPGGSPSTRSGDGPEPDVPGIRPPAPRSPDDRSPTPAGPPAGPRRAVDPPVADAGRPAGVAALSLPSQILVVLALAVVAVVACVHIGMVFLHVAPENTVTKQHGRTIDAWVYPEFEQNWKLFAPNPLQQNVAVQVRAEVDTAGGGVRTTGWYDLSALDGEAIDGNPLPSHTQQNELRRAFDFYLASHDDEGRPSGRRGELSERYLRRVVVMRLEREDAAGRGGTLERVQVRSRTTSVQPPQWSEEQVSDKPVVRELPWWPVTEQDRTGAGR
ncbi:DUF5819 family protein [Streptomyces sp. CRN 30]|uniref:DUF5819 family protein n=1 Tax=Streptomyces sp. CRN 30 TaxID=3075613 RepID=UPI002A837D30|nr:DUF5819 family protein [Streptomyces sp. CRN 30]